LRNHAVAGEAGTTRKKMMPTRMVKAAQIKKEMRHPSIAPPLMLPQP
jgi:hypothetical protein